MTLYLGCYTDSTHLNGLKALRVDDSTRRIEVVAEYPVPNAIYQAFSPDGRWLYSCTGEGLASFAIGKDGNLAGIDALSLGKCVCHVAAMPDGKRVVFADYLGGFAGSVAVENGKFGEVVMHRHSGYGPNLPRQDKAHCHQAIPTPDGKGYCVVDLGLDQIVEYPSGRVFRTSPSGAGPRHLIFHPNGRLAFLVSELGNLVTSLSWNQEKGFETLDMTSTMNTGSASSRHSLRSAWLATNREPRLRGGYASLRLCVKSDLSRLAAAIRFTPDMKRIVVSNRGEDSLAVYDFDSATGNLAFKSRTFLAGSWPRDFMFVSDNLALVALERSGEVHALRYNVATGDFKIIATLGGLFRPVAFCKGVDR